MWMIIRSMQAGSLIFVGMVILVLGPSGSGQAEEDCSTLIRNKCSNCHFVTHICPRIDQGKGSFYWRRTVDDMMKEGMDATDQEQKQLTRCLATPDARVKALCP